MLRVLPWIDGINSVKQIALLADADFKLVKKAIRHLLYYGCVLLLDIFSFSAVYAPTAEMADFVDNEEMQVECVRYVALPAADDDEYDVDSSFRQTQHGQLQGERPLNGTQLVELYSSLKQGQSVKNWYIDHADAVSKIDIRRFITFGVIKGFLYRVHKYAFAPSHSKSSSKGPSKANIERSRSQIRGVAEIKGKGGADGKGKGIAENKFKGIMEAGDDTLEDEELMKYLDGTHCFDEICTDLMISERELMGRLKGVGDVRVICR